MNWTWSIRARDAAMNGLEFARATTASGFSRVLVHAAPARAALEVRSDDDRLLVRADLDREGPYSPMTLLVLDGDRCRRREIWPTQEHFGLPVLLPGGEVGLLTDWHHSADHRWWRWSIELSNHTGRPDDWAPPDQQPQR